MSHHARALRPIDETEVPQLLRPLRERGGAAFTYETVKEGVAVHMSRDGESLTMVLEWAFGSGAKAYTPVGRLGDHYVEHRVSWYRETGKLGLTPGHSPQPPADLPATAGIQQSPETITRCFECHATAVQPGPELSDMRPGVTCERCHGPGANHLAAVKTGGKVQGTILDPRTLSAAASVQLCAQCHRSPDSRFRSTMPELDDPASIRFAPVGFQASECFRQSKDFRCVSCHDPHSDLLPAADSHYTAVCLQCHTQPQTASSECRRAQKQNCIPCHMKTGSPLPHLTFTDHRIRVYPD